jgi:hypothetical protein
MPEQRLQKTREAYRVKPPTMRGPHDAYAATLGTHLWCDYGTDGWPWRCDRCGFKTYGLPGRYTKCNCESTAYRITQAQLAADAKDERV